MIARVVPDVSGIDKQFDYVIPPPLGPRVRPGAVVRVDLHGRRVDAWVLAVGSGDSEGFSDIPAERMLPVLDVADLGVAEEVVPLCEWVAARWAGPLRSVLAAATPARKRARAVNARYGSCASPWGAVPEAVERSWDTGGAVLRVPPVHSALDAVVSCAQRGRVLVLCPTQRMARLGAAALRRRGLTTAELPDEVDAAIAGVDVVIGARSAVLSPCPGMASVVVIDEHEESYQEERVPTWSAPEIAVERARRASVPVYLVSPVPSAWAVHAHGAEITVGEERDGWPASRVVDLSEVPVRGSLVSSELLETVSNSRDSVLCILNTKGGARLVACKSCRELQTCETCTSTVEHVDELLVCRACGTSRQAVCGDCGRTAFVALRSGTTRLAEELRTASRLPVIEVTSSTEGIGGSAAVYVGTEALLHRVSTAGSVVFLDIDRDLAAPRMTAGREVLASLARAARLVGRNGNLIVQSRQPDHPLLRAMSDAALDAWRADDSATARRLGLPPFVDVALCTVEGGWNGVTVPETTGIGWSVEGDRLVARGEREAILAFVGRLREMPVGRVRVAINPSRL